MLRKTLRHWKTWTLAALVGITVTTAGCLPEEIDIEIESDGFGGFGGLGALFDVGYGYSDGYYVEDYYYEEEVITYDSYGYDDGYGWYW